MEREAALDLARTLDSHGFSLVMASVPRLDSWRIGIPIQGLDRDEVDELMALLAEGDTQTDDGELFDVQLGDGIVDEFGPFPRALPG
jgi:hypothetical protein